MTEVEKTVSKVRRARVLFGVAIAAICLMSVAGFVGAILANVVNVQQDTKITKVEKTSACETDPAGAECRAVKRKSDEARPARDFCIGAEKIDHDGELLALTTCREARHRHAQAAADALATEDASGGGEGASVVPGDALAPAEPGSGGAPVPQSPGSNSAPAPPKGGSGTASPAPTASNPPPSASPGETTVSSPSPAVTQPTSPVPANQPGLIQSTVQGVDEAITPTVCAAAELLRHLC